MSACIGAQSTPDASSASRQAASLPAKTVLQTGTQLVVLDVTVQNREGAPVKFLKPSDFKITEGSSAESIKSFEEHSASDLKPARASSMPVLPPGTFTDFRPAPEDDTLSVILVDLLNTPMTDQTYVRSELRKYLDSAPPGKRIAIFALNANLVLLQGFSSDPALLKATLDRKLLSKGSVLLADSSGANQENNSVSDQMAQLGLPPDVVNAVRQFEAQTTVKETQFRAQYTLNAFNQIAHYLAPFPGRKNLIWFSGSFPLAIFPDPTLNDPFEATTEFASQIRETTSLLARSRVAVYPVDARGLQMVPMMDVSQSGHDYAIHPERARREISDFTTGNAGEHTTMDLIAEDTGSRAFYNTNNLVKAVSASLAAGEHYYTLTYSPVNKNWNGSYRHVSVHLQGDTAAAKGIKLSYRTGYYAYDPQNRKTAPITSVLGSASGDTARAGSYAYAHSAMQLGAPRPSEVLFKVRVLPMSKDTETTLAPSDLPNPQIKLKGPFRRYSLDLAAVPSNFEMTKAADGHLHGGIEYITFVYDSEGRLLNQASNVLDLNLSPETYASLLKQGVGFHQEVSAPASGESFLRIAIHDVPSGRLGVVEVPTSLVSGLPPAPRPQPLSASPKGATP